VSIAPGLDVGEEDGAALAAVIGDSDGTAERECVDANDGDTERRTLGNALGA
jgi:hypothetical protein